MENRSSLGLLMLAAGLMVPSVFGQGFSVGKITGVATDTTGAVLPLAEIESVNVATGEVRRTVTNQAGVYVLSPLPIGVYRLEARKEGFKTITRTRVQVDVNSALTLDLRFEVGAVSDSVTVEAAAATIETENQAIGSSRYSQQVSNLPVLVREVHQLIGLSAGVSVGLRGTAAGNYSPGGGQRTPWQLISDGAQLNQSGTNNWNGVDGIGRRADLNVPNMDAVAEVRFVTNGANAEYSQPLQGIVASKSGTNALHGSLFEFYRSGGLGARRWEAPVRESFVRHQSGGSVGGPIRKDKMFFFGAFELFRHTAQDVANGRYPTAAERTGNLASLLERPDAQGRPAPVRLFDPLNRGQLFPNNLIPATRISPVAAELLKLLPVVPAPSGRITDFNAVYSKPLKDNSEKYDARYDYIPGDNDRIFARITWGRLDQASRFSGNVPGLHGGNAKKQYNAAVSSNWTRVFNPATVGVLQFSFRSLPFKNTPTDGGEIFPVKIAGIEAKPPFAGPPAINVGTNGLGIGAPDSRSVGSAFSGLFDRLLFNYEADYGYTLDPTLTKTMGSHTVKVGFQYRQDYRTQELAGRPYGRYTTVSDFNNAGSTVSATGDSFADFLLGYPSSTDVAVGEVGGWVTGRALAWFLQDSWKAAPNLTLNFGLRYDYFGYFTERNGRAAIGDFDSGKILIPRGSLSRIRPEFAPFQDRFLEANRAGLPDNFVKPDRWNFSPRIGAAYRLDGRTVVRGAFGAYTVNATGELMFTQLNSPPFVLRSQLTRNLLLSRNVAVNQLYTFENPTAGVAAAAADTLLASMSGYRADYPAQRAYTWNVTLERDLGWNTGVRASYVANDSRNIPRSVQRNACRPGPTVCLSRAANDPAARPLPQFNIGVGAQTADGFSNYHSLELGVQRRFSQGLLFDVNYTWGKLLAQGTPATNPAAEPLWRYDYGPVLYNPAHIIHFNYVYDLPFGHGRPYGAGANAVLNGILGGWTLAGLSTWQAGNNLTPSAPGQTPTGVGTNRADRVADGRLDHGKPRGDNALAWFDVAAFRLPGFIDPAARQPVRQFGSSGSGIIPGPSFFNYDMTLSKAFPVGESKRLILKGEVFNTLNIPILGAPDLDVTSSNFGRIRTSNAEYSPRSLQLGVRFEF